MCKPHPKQHAFLSSRAQIKAFLGGNQSGKTTAGILDDLIQALDEDILPDRLKPYKKWKPPFRCRIITPDFTGTMEGVVFEKLREWIPRSQLEGGEWAKAYSKQNRKLRFRNGSWFDFMTFEQDLDKFGGTTLHRIHYDEEPPEPIRKEGRMRLMKFGGDELFTMTPLQGMTWMYEAIYERRHEDGYMVVQVDMDDNPHLDPEARRAALDGLTKEERDARKEGKFVHFAGLVFPEFTNDHIMEPVGLDVLKGMDAIVVALDPGLNYAGATWIAFDTENAALIFDELFLLNTDIARMSEAIHRKNREWGLTPTYYVIDPSSRIRQMNTGLETAQTEFNRFGIYAIDGQNDHEAGAFQIKRRLQASPPALRVTKNCQEWINEVRKARKADTPDGKFKLHKDSNPNARNEVLDASRYGLMSRPWMWVPERDDPGHKPWTPNQAPSWDWFIAKADAEAAWSETGLT
jgi:phage terminase large subunit-like protein